MKGKPELIEQFKEFLRQQKAAKTQKRSRSPEYHQRKRSR